MMKIETYLVDDDADSLEITGNYIGAHCPDILLAGTAGSVAAGLALINERKPDLLLLDIELPDGTAFDLLRQTAVRDFEVIFITAYNTYAVEAFRFSAVDFLLKPVLFPVLDVALANAARRIQAKQVPQNWLNLLHNINQQQHARRIAVSTGNEFVFIDLSDIVRLESSSNYTHFYLKDRGKLVSSKTMGYYEDLLPAEKFCRIHHSHIVNIDFVQRYIKNGSGGTVVLAGGLKLDVSQRKKEHFLKLTGNAK